MNAFLLQFAHQPAPAILTLSRINGNGMWVTKGVQVIDFADDIDIKARHLNDT